MIGQGPNADINPHDCTTTTIFTANVADANLSSILQIFVLKLLYPFLNQ